MDTLTKLHQTPRRSEHGSYEPFDGDSRGFLDVLKSFATGLGYNVIECETEEKFDATIYYRRHRIEINGFRSNLNKAYLLCHELAHVYTKILYPYNTTAHQYIQDEQVTEAVAAMILHDFGYDLLGVSLTYIEKVLDVNRQKTRGSQYFHTGKLDKKIKSCYAEFKQDLWEFLTDGGTHVHGDA